jgi:hypothetical protein
MSIKVVLRKFQVFDFFLIVRKLVFWVFQYFGADCAEADDAMSY